MPDVTQRDDADAAGRRTSHPGTAPGPAPDGDWPRTGDPALVLVRHGQTDWSRTGRHTGRTDIELTPTGRQQARAAGDVLRRVLDGRHPAVVISSPRSRALVTAELTGYPVDVVTEDAAEWDYGDYEGLTSEEIHRSDPDWTIWRGPVPNGESADDVTARLDRLLATVAELAADGPAVVFSHGHASRSLTARWLGLPVQAGAAYWLSTGAVSVLGVERQQPAILHWNLDKSVVGSPR